MLVLVDASVGREALKHNERHVKNNGKMGISEEMCRSIQPRRRMLAALLLGCWWLQSHGREGGEVEHLVPAG